MSVAEVYEQTDSRARNFGNKSVELDAIEPDMLRSIVKEALERHLPASKLATLKIAEASERMEILSWQRILSEGGEGE